MKVLLLVILVTIYLQNIVTAQTVVCAVGYKLIGTECVRAEQPCNACANKCSPGFVYRDNACYSTICPDGSPVVNGKCSITIAVKCPEHYVLTEGKCIKTIYGKLICESGFEFENGKCEQKRQEPPQCQFGYFYNSNLKKCTQQVARHCPNGDVSIDGTCRITQITNTTCQMGYTLEGYECVNKAIAECIDGVMEYGECVRKNTRDTIRKCNSDFMEVNGECQKTVIAGNVCPGNSYYDGTRCKIQESLICSSDYFLRGNRCVKQQEVFEEAHCPAGFTNEGSNCAKYTPPQYVCAMGRLVDNYCVITKQPEISCDFGYTLESLTNMCVQKINVPLQCPNFTYILIGKVCIDKIQPQCPIDSTRVGNECHRHTTVPPICTPPAVQSGNNCEIIDTRPPICPDGYSLDNGQCVIYSVIPPTCQVGYTKDITGQCIKIDVIEPCPYGYKYDPITNTCTLIEIPVTERPPGGCGGNSCTSGCSRGGSGCTNTNTNTININNVVNNNNTVSVPTNIHSTNINNISVPKTVEKVEKEKVEKEKDTEENCCTINTPRQCVEESGKWNCQHKKYTRCGSFCRQSQMYLRPVETIYRDNMLVMPPPPRRLPVRNYGHLGKTQIPIN